MATATKTITENNGGSYKSTWTLVYSASNITVTGASFTVPAPDLTAKFVYSGKNQGEVDVWTYPVVNGISYKIGEAETFNKYRPLQSMASGTVYTIPTSTAQDGVTDVTVTTSDIFNSLNSTSRTATLQYVQEAVWLWSKKSSDPNVDNSYNSDTESNIFSTVPTVTLDVPPTATVSVISYDTGFVYAGLTTASVTVSSSTAYYGGNISSVEFAIGSQTATLSGDGTLSIALNAAGTFIPTVTITDSRGQTNTYSLAEITVNTYTAPTVSFDVERTDNTGTPDDEGTYGLIEATLTFADAIADAVAPSVVLTDENGTSTTPVVTWYTDDTLSTVVTWSNVASGDTVYGLFSGLNVNYSYTISVRPRDSEGTGTAITQTISSAFYTVDFLAGGHGIAFGQPSSQTGFACNMTADFLQGVDITGDLNVSNNTTSLDVFLDLPDYQTPATTDYAIYEAVVNLGWDSEVLA